MTTEEKIREWAKAKYPTLYEKYKNNLTIFTLLYTKEKAGNKKIQNIMELEYNRYSEIMGIAVDIKKRSYEGCVLCKRKRCEHKEGKKTYTIISFILGDDTGNIRCTGFDIPAEVEDGKEYVVGGVMKRSNNEIEFVVNTIEEVKE